MSIFRFSGIDGGCRNPCEGMAIKARDGLGSGSRPRKILDRGDRNGTAQGATRVPRFATALIR